MLFVRNAAAALAAAALVVPAAHGQGWSAPTIALTVHTAGGDRQFHVEVADTVAEQERGLMFRTDLPQDGGMLFYPYPPDGPPREASFWMKNTPSALDIIFIRRDGTIAAIAADAEPYSETPLKSGEPVGAVLEINGGLAAKLGMARGDKVEWAGQPG